MLDRKRWLAGAAALVWMAAPSAAWAQADQVQALTSRIGDLTRQLREARLAQQRAIRLAQLEAARARIDRQIAALGKTTPADASPAVVTPLVTPTATQTPAPAPMPAADAVAGAPAGAGPKTKVAAAEGEATTASTSPAEGAASDAPDGRNFGGLDLGAGLSFTIDIGDYDRITRASIVNGKVRVLDQDNGRARLMFESHYFFTPCGRFLGLTNPCTTEFPKEGDSYRVVDRAQARWGFGPFVAIQPGSNQVIDAIGMGLMIGARREMTGQSFNLGIGIVFDPNSQVLGEGFIANQPAPAGETEVRFRETLQTGVLILTSFSF